jgi:hypothetical protein
MAKNKSENKSENIAPESPQPVARPTFLFQGWLGVAVWLGFGLLLESLTAYRIPSYLNDPLRQELFRLAYVHGMLLNIILLTAAICANRGLTLISKTARWSLGTGSVLLPLGFLLGGIWHFEGEAGLGIWLVPLGGLLSIFGVLNLAFAALKKNNSR